jgi:hypothetical protein
MKLDKLNIGSRNLTQSCVRLSSDCTTKIFFIFEPTLLSSGQACIPFRWFTRGRKMYTKAWPLRPVTREMDCGWVVEDFNSFEVSEDDLLVSFKNWDSSEETSGLPHAYSIYGELFYRLEYYNRLSISV